MSPLPPGPKLPPLPPEPKTFTIHEVAEAAGVSPATLRMWEFRYGWPKPSRNRQNSYRKYRQWDIENATRLAALTHEGWRISQLIKDGLPAWPKPGETPPPTATTLHVQLTGEGKAMIEEIAAKLNITPAAAIERAAHAYNNVNQE